MTRTCSTIYWLERFLPVSSSTLHQPYWFVANLYTVCVSGCTIYKHQFSGIADIAPSWPISRFHRIPAHSKRIISTHKSTKTLRANKTRARWESTKMYTMAQVKHDLAVATKVWYGAWVTSYPRRVPCIWYTCFIDTTRHWLASRPHHFPFGWW